MKRDFVGGVDTGTSFFASIYFACNLPALNVNVAWFTARATVDESLLGPWNTYQREQEGDVRGGEEEGGCVHFTRKDGKTSKERQRKGEERGTQEISRAWMAYKKKIILQASFA